MESWPQAILSEGVARQRVEAGHRRRWGHVHQPGIESIVHLREMRSNGTRAESNGVVSLKGTDEAALPCRALDDMVVCRRPDSPEVATPSMAARGAAALRVSRCVRVSRATVHTPAWLLTSDGDDCPHEGDEGEAMQEINATAWCERGTRKKADGRSV
ncbi:hypothetical protein D1007_29367 [Hordeum vulgare]|nr:hypothetical protein D1007_29367 [Hordeum vulgare]